MARHYTTRDFFRQIPNLLLARYFHERDLLRNLDFAAKTDPKEVAEILRALDVYEGTLTVRCALRLAPLVFVRPGELRRAEWADIDLEGKQWRFTVTKTNTPHIVPLSRQAMEILRELYPLTGSGRFVFTACRGTMKKESIICSFHIRSCQRMKKTRTAERSRIILILLVRKVLRSFVVESSIR